MALDRLDIVVIGRSCEVDNCVGICVDEETRCWDHSVNRLVATLFNQNEQCKFGGATCTVQATCSNSFDVPMCETCYAVHQRTMFRRGGTVYDGGSYHRNINWEALIESARDGNEEEVDEMLDLMQRAYESAREEGEETE
jgi:hypothetical protein